MTKQIYGVWDPWKCRFFRLTLTGENKPSLYISVQSDFLPKVHFHTLPTYSFCICFVSAGNKEATQRQTHRHPWLWCGSHSPRQPLGVPQQRATSCMCLQHTGTCGESAHNQTSRDMRKPKALHGISITVLKALVVANVILQMVNQECSGWVGIDG